MTECLKSIPVSLILWCGCWWAKQSTAFILQDSSREWYGHTFLHHFWCKLLFIMAFIVIWAEASFLSCVNAWCGDGFFYTLCSYRSTFSLWPREIREGKGQIRVVKRAGGGILGGERHVSSVGKLLHQTQRLTLAHVEQNMFVSREGN